MLAGRQLVATCEAQGVQYIGVSAPEGLHTLTIVPYHVSPSTVAPTVIHRIYTK